MNRPSAIAALRLAVQEALEAAEAGAAAAYDEATGEESRAENEYDTRSLEASYLAAGVGRRVTTLRSLRGFVGSLDPKDAEEGARIGIGRFVQVEDEDGREAWYVLASDGGGMTFDVQGEAVRVLTPTAPLGRSLLGSEVDDDVETPTGTVLTVIQVV